MTVLTEMVAYQSGAAGRTLQLNTGEQITGELNTGIILIGKLFIFFSETSHKFRSFFSSSNKNVSSSVVLSNCN